MNKTKRRVTFQKALEKERALWRWSGLPREAEALVLAFCACIALRMKGESMDELIEQCQKPKP